MAISHDPDVDHQSIRSFRDSICSKQSTSQFTDKTPWLSIGLVAALTMCTAAQFSVYFSSMWPYLQRLDPDITEPFFGFSVAIYSFGQIVFAPPLGWWSNKIKSIRHPVVVAISLQMAGNFIYLFAQAFPAPHGKYAVAFSRFLCGLGASNIGLLKTYAATASRKEDRSRSIATVTGGLALGLIVGPAIQLIFTPIGEKGWRITSWFALNMYTTPPLAVCLVNITAMCLMGFVFKEVYAGLLDSKSSQNLKLIPADTRGVWMCYFTRFAQMFAFSSVETLSAPIAMTMFALSRSDAVTLIALVHGAMSVLELSMYISFVGCKLDRFINNRLVCLLAFVGIGLFYVISFPWPFLPNKLVMYNETNSALAPE
uniref:MFS domain-containing protein n=1 Tax=Bursaphelenchus xylophilus TaxID=6326 RepID=A0A1I7S6C0_BURXY